MGMVEPPSRAILEDRYDGLLAGRGCPTGEWGGKAWGRLNDALTLLYERTARAELHADVGDQSGRLLDEIHGEAAKCPPAPATPSTTVCPSSVAMR